MMIQRALYFRNKPEFDYYVKRLGEYRRGENTMRPPVLMMPCWYCGRSVWVRFADRYVGCVTCRGKYKYAHYQMWTRMNRKRINTWNSRHRRMHPERYAAYKRDYLNRIHNTWRGVLYRERMRRSQKKYYYRNLLIKAVRTRYEEASA